MDPEPFEVSRDRIRFGDVSWEGNPRERVVWLVWCDTSILGIYDSPEKAQQVMDLLPTSPVRIERRVVG